MAKKKSRKERNRERHEAMQRVRQETGWSPPEPIAAAAESRRDMLYTDMLPLFPELLAGARPRADAAEHLSEVILDSVDLADEPELEEIFFPPVQCVDAYIEIREERGWLADSAQDISEEEQEARHVETIGEMAGRLLTADLRRQILAGLERLWQRARSRREQPLAARAATILAFLEDLKPDQEWPVMGLVLPLIDRSLAAGLSMASVAEGLRSESEGAMTEERGGEQVAFIERFSDSELVRQTEEVLHEFPGLKKHLEKEAERIWDGGQSALLSGELYLELFSPEELEPGFELFTSILRPEGEKTDPAHTSREAIEAFHAGVKGLVAHLLPGRIDQIEARLADAWPEVSGREDHKNFVLMLLQDVRARDMEVIEGTLTAAFIGEMTVLSARAQAEEEEEE